ncbi:acyl-CoA synthetase [Tistrella bauzanensis]|uniref:Acyl-CoA synthetase n=1 Tax=Tistrella bauzanensis TaxID=657419 RepID=A0ABQ1I952_9PROT|nr:acyl-CoA synthetase [Tistrella bauzanensis]GGB29152.1 acyl-CoA synthetase [Tistrella bauzanensis]
MPADIAPSKYERDLDRNPANHQPLTPLSLLERTADVHPDRVAVIHGDQRWTYRDLYARCRRLGSALKARGIGRGDTVSIMAPNTPAMLEAHYGVPMIGAVLNELNIRLDAEALAFILTHAETRVLLTDREFSPVIKAALDLLDTKPLVIDIDDPAITHGDFLGETEYEALLAEGDPDFAWQMPADEWESLSLGYTSGTTGDPKGVVYSHRGAWMNGINNILTWDLPKGAVYLWTLPMFHCSGWCFPYTMVAAAGTQVCLRKVEAKAIFDAIATNHVTHLCGAPTVLSLLVHAPDAVKRSFDHTVHMMTAASAPPSSVIAGMEAMGFEITHVYGLTEVYGPVVVCEWKSEWDEKPLEERARIKARQGVRYTLQQGLMVADPETMEPVPADGQTMGEVMMRGNITMKGYLKNRSATEKAFAGGWFHSGDLGVTHPDGYIELKDRSKDIIISGGENISSIEVEEVLYGHPAVLEAAVVARPDEKWGETPCAFVTLKPDSTATEADIRAHCEKHLARFKLPKTFIFTDLPKTSTGKVQKFVLREKARAL